MMTRKPEMGALVQDNLGRQYKVVGLGSKMAVLEAEPPVPNGGGRITLYYEDFFEVTQEAATEEEFEMNEFKKQLELYE
jgi:hypothetical protein